MDEPWQIRFSSSARRHLDRTPEKIAAAVIEFTLGSLRHRPTIVGKPLRWELQGHYAARRGDWRIIYSLDHDAHTILITRVEHRAHVYYT